MLVIFSFHIFCCCSFTFFLIGHDKDSLTLSTWIRSPLNCVALLPQVVPSPKQDLIVCYIKSAGHSDRQVPFWAGRSQAGWWPPLSSYQNQEGFNLGCSPLALLIICFLFFFPSVSVVEFQGSHPQLCSASPGQDNSLRGPRPPMADYSPSREGFSDFIQGQTLLIPATQPKWKGRKE